MGGVWTLIFHLGLAGKGHYSFVRDKVLSGTVLSNFSAGIFVVYYFFWLQLVSVSVCVCVCVRARARACVCLCV